MIMLSDTHCHLDFPEYDLDRKQVIIRAQEQGVGYIINVGSSLEASRNSVKLASDYDIVWAGVGVHPHEADSFNQDILRQTKDLIKQDKVVAIGEIGLDYYRNLSAKKNQKDMFVALLGLAEEVNLPVIIHNREASQDTFDILKATLRLPIKGVVHCFSAGREFLDKFLDAGLHVSFTCNITYKKTDELKELAKYVPIDRLLLETDAPFLSPQIFRGKRNEPSNVRYLAQALAHIKGMDLEDLTKSTYENGRKLFGI